MSAVSVDVSVDITPDVSTVEEIVGPHDIQCEGNACDHAPAVAIVHTLCRHCGPCQHFLCRYHTERLAAKPGKLWVHTPCGTPRAAVTRIDPL